MSARQRDGAAAAGQGSGAASSGVDGLHPLPRDEAGARRGARRRAPPGFLTALGMTFGLMVLLAGGVADQDALFPLVVLGMAAGAVGLLYLMFPHGPQFALGTATGLAMYACLYVVIGRAAFPWVWPWARAAAFTLPIAAFVAACWVRRRALRAWAQGEHLGDLAHLPRFLRWLGAVAAVGVLCISLPVNRLDAAGQSVVLLGAMAAIAAISARSVGDVVRLLVDIALIFQAVTRRLAHLAVPIAAYSLLWSLLVVVFGSLYRIADGFSKRPLFHDSGGNAIRIDFADALHFSVVTLSTVGYGDIQPADDGIRLLASMQMLLAQLLLLFGFVEIMRGSEAGGLGKEASAAAAGLREGPGDGAAGQPPPRPAERDPRDAAPEAPASSRDIAPEAPARTPNAAPEAPARSPNAAPGAPARSPDAAPGAPAPALASAPEVFGSPPAAATGAPSARRAAAGE